MFLKNQYKKYVAPTKKKLAIITLCVIAIPFLFYGTVFFGAWGTIPSKQEIANIRQHQATTVLSNDGQLLGKFYIDDRQPVPYSMFPEHLLHALIATEDARFYAHHGVDTKSVLRVIFKTILLQNASSGGGSTLSQQLAKNLYPRKNYGKFGIVIHKIRESIIAKRIETVYSKQEVLTQYLNTVPFSDNCFGIESAAKKFFNTTTQELTIPEAAVLVGMLKASHSYNPRLFPEKSKQRRNTVLAQMVHYNYLNTKKAQQLMSTPIALDYQNFGHHQGIAPYFRAQVRKDLEAWCQHHKDEQGNTYNAYTSGLKIHTTIDYTLQQMAEQAMAKHLEKLQDVFEKDHGKAAPWNTNKKLLAEILKNTKAYKKLKNKGIHSRAILDSLSIPHEMEWYEWGGKKVVEANVIDSVKHYLKFLNAGLVSMTPDTGAIQSWVGGINYEYSQYDHVIQSKRQVGSTFKPIVYTAALENGMAPCAHIAAKTVTYKNMENWAPSNSSSTIDPNLRYSLQAALSKSINTIAVKVLEDTGIKRTTAIAKKMGITSAIPQVPSMALGTAELNLLELTAAYCSYVNHGKPAVPYYITQIVDSNGIVLEDFEPKSAESAAFSEETRQIMLEYMKATVHEGTATRLRNQYRLTNAIAGKTGTTQNNKDGWFVGITPKLVMATWVGSDNHSIGFRSTTYGQGANSALPIVALLLQQMNQNKAYNPITKAQFPKTSIAVKNQLNCARTSRENFFQRIFKNPNKNRKKAFKNAKSSTKKKKGLFSNWKKK